MKIACTTLLCSLLLLCSSPASAQCNTGEIEVSITVHTDGFGYEAYWQLIPAENNCGTGTIFAGGNTNIGCSGGGERTQSSGGYGDFQTITEGPWCLNLASDYSIYLVDDWGDGGTSFDVIIDGYTVRQFTGTGVNERFTFSALHPAPVDGAITEISVYPSVKFESSSSITGIVRNMGTTAINAFDIGYSANGSTPVTETISGLNIAPFSDYYFTHSTPWSPVTHGPVTLVLSLSNVNGQGADAYSSNDTLAKNITVSVPIPNIMDLYTRPNNTMKFDTVARASDEVRTPRDLDFQPGGRLWVINKETEQSGGTTLTITNPGQPGQHVEFLQDGNAWHFMSLPTAIAFSDNGNFATSPGVLDANHDGGPPFTGPSLWSSDLSIYAQPSGGNGSHLDMLHESPEAMGIANEKDNKFWVFDSYHQDIVSYDFKGDHGPGNDDHSDGIIHRYTGMTVDRINEHIVCHVAYDHFTNWLYIVDGVNQRILRLDTKSGTPGGAPPDASGEQVSEHILINGATWETVVDNGLQEPAGIDVFRNHLIVSDHFNGDIIIYDISSLPATELTRIATGSAGVMGLVVGPDGRIWYVNANNNTVMRIEPDSIPVIDTSNVGISPLKSLQASAYPVPADEVLNIFCSSCDDGSYQITVFNILGEQMLNRPFADKRMSIDISQWTPGIYTAMLRGNGGGYMRKIVVE